MGRIHAQDEITPNSNLYPEELQLKLYQAFIFSIPILFSIILFLLFYLFYLKRRANNMASQPSRIQHPTGNHPVAFISQPWTFGIKGELKDKLHAVQFDEELKAKETLCCVCLGEFEMKEELQQLPLCKHVFHGDCIRHWLRTNATCPLCRCPLIPAIKTVHSVGLRPNSAQLVSNPAEQEEQSSSVGSTTSELHLHSSSRAEEHVIQITDASSSINISGSQVTTSNGQ